MPHPFITHSEEWARIETSYAPKQTHLSVDMTKSSSKPEAISGQKHFIRPGEVSMRKLTNYSKYPPAIVRSIQERKNQRNINARSNGEKGGGTPALSGGWIENDRADEARGLLSPTELLQEYGIPGENSHIICILFFHFLRDSFNSGVVV